MLTLSWPEAAQPITSPARQRSSFAGQDVVRQRGARQEQAPGAQHVRVEGTGRPAAWP